jgi:fructokinase
LYHGTLIARNSASYGVLEALREMTQLPAFVDINLRNPWWNGEIVETTLDGARWGKMNRDELGEIVNDPVLTPETTKDAARELCQRYGLEFLIITLGADGACVISEAAVACAPAPKIENLLDTIGAGDAFSAVTLLGLIMGWPLPIVQQRALEFAAAICQIPGAISQENELYAGHLARWKS